MWRGLVSDLLVVPALLWKGTRVFGYLLCVVFHLTNTLLWKIGIFAWFMIGVTLLFFSPKSFRRFLSRHTLKIPDQTENRQQHLVVRCPGVYMAWQLLWPFRHFLYPRKVSWNEEGHHFSWHRMLHDKGVGIRFSLFDRSTGKPDRLKVSTFLNERQLSRIRRIPT